MAGRPTKYSDKLAAKICEQLSMGRSLRSVCQDKGMPAASSVFLWLQKHPEFSEQYARAKEESADAMAEDMLDIADHGSLSPQDKRVRIDTRKWLASKLKPKKYGDKAGEPGSDSTAPIYTKIEHIVRDP